MAMGYDRNTSSHAGAVDSMGYAYNAGSPDTTRIGQTGNPNHCWNFQFTKECSYGKESPRTVVMDMWALLVCVFWRLLLRMDIACLIWRTNVNARTVRLFVEVRKLLKRHLQLLRNEPRNGQLAMVLKNLMEVLRLIRSNIEVDGVVSGQQEAMRMLS